MATVADNVLIQGLRGRLGESLVFKTMRGKTFVATPARKPDKRKESTAQRNTRTAFRQATEWAQYILLNPERKAYYSKRAKALKLPNAYTAALTDYMRKPQLTTFTNKDKSIHCRVSKKGFALTKVEVVLHDADNNSKEIRTVQQPTDKAIAFNLMAQEQYTGVILYAYDQADRVTTWNITSDTGT